MSYLDGIDPEELQMFMDTYGKNSPKTANEMLNASRGQALEQTLGKPLAQESLDALPKTMGPSTAKQSAHAFEKAIPAGIDEGKALVPYIEKQLPAVIGQKAEQSVIGGLPAVIGNKAVAPAIEQGSESLMSRLMSKVGMKGLGTAAGVAGIATDALSAPNDNGDWVQGLPGTPIDRPKAGDMENQPVPGRPGYIFAGQDIIPAPLEAKPMGMAESLHARHDLPMEQATADRGPAVDDAPVVGRSLASRPSGSAGTDPSKTIDFGTGSINTVANLRDAQDREGRAVLANQLGKAGEIFGAALAHVEPTAQSAFDANIKQAGNITKNFKEQGEQEQNDPNSPMSKGAREVMKRFGITVKGDASYASLMKVAPWLEKVYTADETRKQRAFDAEQNRLLRQSISDNNLAAREASNKDKTDAKKEKTIADLRQKMKKDLDPNQARGGNLAASQKMVNAAERVEALFNQFPDGNIPVIQTHELSSAVAGLINGGSAQSQKQIDSLTPKSLKGDAAAIASWITNDPRGAGQQKFMKLLHETTIREKETAQHQVKKAQIQRVASFSDFKKLDPEGYNAELSAAYIAPEEIDEKGQYKPLSKKETHNTSGKIKVSNGKETLMIDAKDLDHATKDGYKQVQ